MVSPGLQREGNVKHWFVGLVVGQQVPVEFTLMKWASLCRQAGPRPVGARWVIIGGSVWAEEHVIHALPVPRCVLPGE